MTKNPLSPRKLTSLDIKRLRFWVWVFVIIGMLGVIKACDRFYRHHNPELPYSQAQKQSRDPMQVVRHQIVNGQDLWIPVPYFMHFAPPDGVTKDVLLVVMHPDFSPITEDYTKLWREGSWDKKIMILFGDPTGRKTTKESYQSLSRSYQASEFQKKEFDLNHYSQPSEIRNDQWEFWVEGAASDPKSFISCGRKVSKISNPQCSLRLQKNGLTYEISFDKDLLEHWKDIKNRSLALVEKFRQQPSSQVNRTKSERHD